MRGSVMTRFKGCITAHALKVDICADGSQPVPQGGAPGGDVRPRGESGMAGVRCPRWGREAPGTGGARWCEAPLSPQGGPPWGYCANHMTPRGNSARTDEGDRDRSKQRPGAELSQARKGAESWIFLKPFVSCWPRPSQNKPPQQKSISQMVICVIYQLRAALSTLA